MSINSIVEDYIIGNDGQNWQLTKELLKDRIELGWKELKANVKQNPKGAFLILTGIVGAFLGYKVFVSPQTAAAEELSKQKYEVVSIDLNTLNGHKEYSDLLHHLSVLGPSSSGWDKYPFRWENNYGGQIFLGLEEGVLKYIKLSGSEGISKIINHNGMDYGIINTTQPASAEARFIMGESIKVINLTTEEIEASNVDIGHHVDFRWFDENSPVYMISHKLIKSFGEVGKMNRIYDLQGNELWSGSADDIELTGPTEVTIKHYGMHSRFNKKIDLKTGETIK